MAHKVWQEAQPFEWLGLKYIIWDIAHKDIPVLIVMMEPLVPPEEKA